MIQRVADIFSHLSFATRLLLTATLALVVAGVAMLSISARQEAIDSQQDLANELSTQVNILPPALSEVVVIGDYTTLKQLLDNHIKNPSIAKIQYRDKTGTILESHKPVTGPYPPDWFVNTFNFQNITSKNPVKIGGREYGELSITINSQPLAYRTWQRLIGHLGILVLAVSLDFIGIWFVLKTGLKPLLRLEDGVTALSAGKFCTHLHVDGSPEMRKLIAAFNETATKLSLILNNVKSAAEQVAVDSQLMSHHADDVFHGSTEQAIAAEEVSSSMTHMVIGIQSNVTNALKMEEISLKAAQEATESGTIVQQAMSAMKEIARKLTVIEDISQQTRILSLNAAIEAARAREHGKGFAVVATEVKNLAERSQHATKEIKQLIQSTMQIADQASSMISQFIPTIQQVAKLVQEINHASHEQRSGTEQINAALQQLNLVIQQNTAISEQLSATAQQFSTQAVHLREVIDFFN